MDIPLDQGHTNPLQKSNPNHFLEEKLIGNNLDAIIVVEKTEAQ